jgi:hypothetical protein
LKKSKRKNIIRRFTIQALENCETLMLTIEELEKMRLEFPEVFSELFNGVYQRFQKDLILKVDNIKKEEQK